MWEAYEACVQRPGGETQPLTLPVLVLNPLGQQVSDFHRKVVIIELVYLFQKLDF